MKSKQAIFITVIIVSVALIAAFTAVAITHQDTNIDETPYVLKAKENYLVLYKYGKEVEEFKTVNYSALPEYDRNTLKKGIEFSSIEEVYAAIEDFDG